MPAADVDAGDMGCHLNDLDRVEGTESMGILALLLERGKESKELLGHVVRRVVCHEGRAKSNHVLGRVRPGSFGETGGAPPSLDLGNLLGVVLSHFS